MKIAIISDIHDNVWNLRAAMHWLASLQGDEAAQELICHENGLHHLLI